MIDIRGLYLLAILLLLGSTQANLIPCENQSKTWKAGKKMQISEQEYIFSTFYDQIDAVIDSNDEDVFKSVQSIGTWKPQFIRVMAKFIKQGSTVLIIGSRTGLQAAVMGKIIREKGKLLIFQPFSLSHNLVFKNLYINKLGNIATVFSVGAGNKHAAGFISAKSNKDNSYHIVTNESVKKNISQAEQIQIYPVDDVLPEKTVIDLAVVDLQKTGLEALQGMNKTIVRSANLVLMCQWSGHFQNSQDINNKKKNVLNWFSSRKYKFYVLSSEVCGKQQFKPVDAKYILDLKVNQQIFFVPGHIDPSKFK